MATTPGTLAVRVRLFGRYAELLGAEQVAVELPPPATVRAVLERLRAEHPAAAALPRRPLVAVNLRQVPLEAELGAGDEVALLPPLSGG